MYFSFDSSQQKIEYFLARLFIINPFNFLLFLPQLNR